jgi:hypothetical protein
VSYAYCNLAAIARDIERVPRDTEERLKKVLPLWEMG